MTTGSESFGGLAGTSAGEGITEAQKLLSTLSLGTTDIITDFLKKVLPDAMESQITSFKTSYQLYEKSIYDLQVGFLGGGAAFEKNIRTSIADATSDMLKIGASQADTIKIQKSILSTLNTEFIPATTILIQQGNKAVEVSSNIYPNLYANAKLLQGTTADGAVDSGKMIANFKSIGVNLYDIGTQTNKILETAKQIGVSATAVYSQLEKNIATMNTFNFANGVEGMAKMASHAAMLRIDMGKTLGLAEDLLSPEKAIETAATFQRLGIQTAELLDPMKLMDMALNAPQELQKALQSAAKEFVFLNDQSGKFEIRPGMQLAMREVATAAKMSTAEFAQFALSAGEVEEKMKRIPSAVQGQILSEEDKTLIANLGQLRDGKLVVTIPGTDELVDASLLDKEKLEMLRAQQQETGQTTEELLNSSNTLLVQQLNALKAIQESLPSGLAAADEVFKDIPEALTKSVSDAMKDVSDIIKEGTQGVVDASKLSSSGVRRSSSEILQELGITKESLTEALDVSDLADKLLNYFGVDRDDVVDIVQVVFDKLKTLAGDVIITRDGIIQTAEVDEIVAKPNIASQFTVSPPTTQNIPTNLVSIPTTTNNMVGGEIKITLDVGNLPTGMDVTKFQETMEKALSSENFLNQLTAQVTKVQTQNMINTERSFT